MCGVTDVDISFSYPQRFCDETAVLGHVAHCAVGILLFLALAIIQFHLQLSTAIMYLDEIAKRYYYNNYRSRNNWYRYRWFLWLILIPVFLILLALFLMRRRRRNRQVTVQPNNQYYQTQQAGGYYNGQQGGIYGDSSAYPPQQPGYGGNGSYQQGYSREPEYNVNGEDFSRPEGPPPAHYKA